MKVKVEKTKKYNNIDMGPVEAKGRPPQDRVVAAETSAEECGSTVVVGVRMDAQSRELLTWALVKVAQTGDRVIALHILPNSNGDNPSSLIGLISSFESILAVYEGFCNLKQIDLKLKVCRGSSLRKVLVREAAAVNAAHIILGVAKGNHGLGSSSSVSIAKYCAKKVPSKCGVAAVSNGKVVFQREPSQPPQLKDLRSSRMSKKNTKLVNGGSNDSLLCLLPNKVDASQRISVEHGKLQSSGAFPAESCSICNTLSASALTGSGEAEVEGVGTLSSVPPQEIESEAGAAWPLVPEGPKGRKGWPAVRRLVVHERKLSFSEKTKSSVVQWAMRLPSRYSAIASIHPDRKSLNLENNDRSGVDDKKVADTACSEGALKISKEMESLSEKYASVCRLFMYKELADATSSFSADNLIGKGGHSCVYKGHLPDGRELAVKVLKQTKETVKEFSMEIEIISSLCHKNIISLVGFCFDNNDLLLVYDLLSRGSLDQHLHGINSDEESTLVWEERYKIAVGVAEALEYLHEGCGRSQPAIHRDVKSSNILLSEDFEPRLSDFGFATWASSSSSLVTCTDVVGTFGYLAPEYFVFGKVNEKIDVYAFGIVVLELLTGRRPIGKEYPKGQESLVMWAKPFLQNEKAKLLLDPRLGTEYDADQVERMILATSLCTRRAPKLRPKMSVVLKLLLGDEDAIKSARLRVKASEELEEQDEEPMYPALRNIQSHLSLALLDVEDDALSLSSASYNISHIIAHEPFEAYLQGRCSRLSSFD